MPMFRKLFLPRVKTHLDRDRFLHNADRRRDDRVGRNRDDRNAAQLNRDVADRQLHWVRAVVMHDDRRVSQLIHYARQIVIAPRSQEELYEEIPNEGDLTEILKARVHRKDGDFAVTWAKMYGKGRVFYSTLGHVEANWDRPEMQTMIVEAIKWVLKLVDADVTPRAAR